MVREKNKTIAMIKKNKLSHFYIAAMYLERILPMLLQFKWQFMMSKMVRTHNFLKYFIYLFQTEGKGGRETSNVVASHVPPTGDLTWPATQASVLTGNRTSNPFAFQVGAQSTAPHQSGQNS